LVIGGDFNLVQNIQKDKKGGSHTTHFKSLEEIEKFKENMNLRTYGVIFIRTFSVLRGEEINQKFIVD